MSYQPPEVGNEISCVMHGIDEKLLYNTKALERKIIGALNKEKFTILDIMSHKFKPHGYTLAILLSESHIAAHTYPEYNSFYFSIYSCRGKEDGAKTYEAVKKYLKPKSIDYSNKKIVVKK
ncbi:adenosylmethionine decarboxylase [Candidatus Campbellbacteria bacterium CG10_big_fil_rev_8_21_14_0_10_35_52]|uniref:Adenosylmethionine decarboxylase n=1 Tax=Candidatus Campbellbacteria bacterium CG10_big_fil_rev_8_21_14_0_10_35_52 TaxID=1974527 RepID=A0A2M6WW19_9BACT|nr:MAG: adenosylmethionine decarboxylase [Candidatus Campbellbacteria bacterium CG10_big_fil_rev_8_21_14_0_10_35_52]